MVIVVVLKILLRNPSQNPLSSQRLSRTEPLIKYIFQLNPPEDTKNITRGHQFEWILLLGPPPKYKADSHAPCALNKCLLIKNPMKILWLKFYGLANNSNSLRTFASIAWNAWKSTHHPKLFPRSKRRNSKTIPQYSPHFWFISHELPLRNFVCSMAKTKLPCSLFLFYFRNYFE